MPPRPHAQAGFTLMEAIVAIVIAGIVAGIVAVFIRGPIDSYFDVARRAALTDTADGALRRMARDLRLALPNSVRQPAGSDQCIEFMPTKAGGRYRASKGVAADDPLDFGVVDTSFEMLGLNGALPAEQRLATGDIVAVYNDGSAAGNAYLGTNAVRVAGLAEGAGTTTITLAAAGAGLFDGKPFPAASPAMRFQVVPAAEQAVAYVCSGVGTDAKGNGTGRLYRYARALAAAYPTPGACPAPPAGTPILADRLSQCSLKYEGDSLQRNGLISMTLTLQSEGEPVGLYHQVQVNNTP